MRVRGLSSMGRLNSTEGWEGLEVGEETIRAKKEFRMDDGMKSDGR